MSERGAVPADEAPLTVCPQCGLSYAAASTLGGQCPRCLLAGTASRSGDGADWRPPSPTELTARLPAFEVQALIGRGGMGAVYRARERALERTVAIKLLPAVEDAFGVGYRERFRNEARVLARLTHPGIVRVHGCGELESGWLYFVMEHVEGTDLARLMQDAGRLPPARALRIAAEVCAALHSAHEAGVVHRDVKPANVLVGRDGAVKVVDFGLAKRAGATPGLTTGLVLGTADYVAPEALVPGGVVDRRADVYAVGVMLYFLLTGEVPRGVFVPASRRVAGVSAALDRVIARAMRQEPAQRFATAAEMQAALEAAAAGRGGRAARRGFVVAVAALALGAVVWRVWPEAKPRPPEPTAWRTLARPPGEIANAAAQRVAAEWVLRKGGRVTLEGRTERIARREDLPAEAFQVAEIYFENVEPVDGPMTDADLARLLPELPALHQFVIVQSPGVSAGLTEASARLLAAKRELRDVGLDGVRLGDEAIRRLAALPRLRTLVLSHSAIRGDCLRACAEHLTIISLTECEIDAAAWEVIGGMRQLEIARFIGAAVDEAMVRAICGLPSLIRLGWLNDPATEPALARIREAHPGLSVRRFESWNRPPPPPRPAAP